MRSRLCGRGLVTYDEVGHRSGSSRLTSGLSSRACRASSRFWLSTIFALYLFAPTSSILEYVETHSDRTSSDLRASVAVTHSFNRRAWIALCGAVGHPGLAFVAFTCVPASVWLVVRNSLIMHTDAMSPKSSPQCYVAIIFLHQSTRER